MDPPSASRNILKMFRSRGKAFDIFSLLTALDLFRDIHRTLMFGPISKWESGWLSQTIVLSAFTYGAERYQGRSHYLIYSIILE